MPLPRRALLGSLGSLALGPLALASRPASAARRFTPPGPEARAAALGPLGALSPSLRAAFTPDVDDLPIPTPGSMDWLTDHPEPGQTYAEFLREGFNAPSDARRTIVVVPLVDDSGDPSESTEERPLGPGAPAIDDLVDFIARYYQMPARAAEALALGRLRASSRRSGRRRQYLTGDLLRALVWRLPADAYCLIAVTSVDLYPGRGWNFVFGEATFRERVGVHSFARYDPAFTGQARGEAGERLILRRGLKVMAHEVGHMLSLHHCTHYHCLMNGTNHLGETDRAPQHLCPVCRRKLHAVVAYDPIARERALAEFYRAHGLTGPADRSDRRRTTLEAVAAVEAEASAWLRDVLGELG